MKLNWILYITISIVLFQPFLSIAESEIKTEDKQKTKPDQDKEDPLNGADVTIRKEKDRVIEEYRINGKLLQVKITPKHGYPYYLIDTDADGTFDVRSSEAWKNTTVNTWKIFQW
jgi:Protein of unknown function (DUF2782)